MRTRFLGILITVFNMEIRLIWHRCVLSVYNKKRGDYYEVASISINYESN